MIEVPESAGTSSFNSLHTLISGPLCLSVVYYSFNAAKMKPFNWKQFTKRIPISASAKSIYEAWSCQQGLESWFLRLAEFTKPDGSLRMPKEQIHPGDRYRWRWHGYEDSSEEKNEVLEVNGWDMIRFSFSEGCIVTVTVKQEAGENICELKQDMPMEDLPTQQYFYIECGKGWTFYLANLKSILEGGLDLRNKNSSIQVVVNA
jgi:uncharacterized protein YndB with AHSA1/START domain